MTTFILSFVGIGLIFMFGYKLCRILLPSGEFVEHFLLGFILGCGIFTLLWFILNWIGIPFNLLSGMLLLLSLLLITLFLERTSLNKNNIKKRITFSLSYFKKMTMFEWVLVAIIVFFCLSSLLQTIYWPVRYWDSLVLYDFRAKVFAQTGFMQMAISQGFFFPYPPFTSLVHTWIYILGLSNPSFFYSLLYIFFIIIFFDNVRKFNVGRTLSLFVTVLIVISPRFFDHTLWAYTNLPFSIFIILGSIYLYWGIRNKNLGSYIASAILVGLSSWTRSMEPFWLSCFVVAIIAPFFEKKCIWPFIYSAVLASAMLPWRYFRSINRSGTFNVSSEVITTSGVAVKNFFDFSILKPVFDYVIMNVVYMYLGYFIIFAFIVFVKFIKMSKSWVMVLLVFLNLCITFGGTLVFATSFTYWNKIPDSLARMVMFIPPMVVFLFVECISELKIISKKNES